MVRGLVPFVALLLLAGCLSYAPAGPDPAPTDATPAPSSTQAPPSDDRRPGDLRLVSRIPEVPGYPEGLHHWNGTLFVGTVPFNQPDQPPVLYVIDLGTGETLQSLEADVPLGGDQGLAGMTVDGRGRLYVGEGASGSVLRFVAHDGSYRQETYVTIPDLPPCPAAGACSPTPDDRKPLPNDVVFDADGTLFVTDSYQATIWSVPPGEAPGIWYQHAAIDGQFGPNCIRISPDRQWVYFTVSGDVPVDTDRFLMRVPFPDPGTSEPEAVIRFTPNDFPDGCAFGQSGRLYVGLNIQNQVIAVQDGREVARWPDAQQNAQSEVPVDFPASMVFDDERRSLLLTNYSAFWSAFPVHPQTDHFAVLEMYVDDVSAGPARPMLDPWSGP